MSDKKELNSKELNEVAGGGAGWATEGSFGYEIDLDSRVSKDDRYSIIGKDVCIKREDGVWSLVHVLSSYEKSVTCGTSATFVCETLHGTTVHEFEFDKYCVYTNYKSFQMTTINLNQ